MKIAVLSDIHGNLTALDAVLEYCKNQGIDYYIVAGDHISDCPHPNEVLDVISKLNGWFINGNRELFILKSIDEIDGDFEKYRHLDSLIWTRDQLKPNNIDFIRNLPVQETISLLGYDSIRVVHGSTEDVYEHLYPHKEERLIEIISTIDEKVLICGHTHMQWSKYIDNTLIFNPGSVGVSFVGDGTAQFAILSWLDDEWKVNLHNIKYDLNNLEYDFKNKGLYDKGGIWPKLTIDTLRDGVNKRKEFIQMCNQNAAKLGYEKQIYYSNDVWEMTEKQWNEKNK